MSGPRTFGLIPAAGQSRRMGRPKLTLPLGGRTVIEWVITALRAGGVADILVVAGPHDPALPACARAAGAGVLELAEATAEMRETIERGLAWIEQHWQPHLSDGFLLSPADHPTLDGRLVAQLLESRSGQPNHSIFIPVFAGRRGHPTWIAWQHVTGLRAFGPGQGLNAYLRQFAEETYEMPAAAEAADLDTPEDYERVLRTWSKSMEMP